MRVWKGKVNKEGFQAINLVYRERENGLEKDLKDKGKLKLDYRNRKEDN